jgi:outer membrane protein OmpA-like peptidoglycan-associated protein
MKFTCSFLVPLLLLAGLSAFAPAATASPDSLSLYFASGKVALTAAHQQTLDSLLYAETDSRQPLQIWGAADEPGTTPQNKSIAQARAEAVKAYLLESGIRPSRIVSCEGRGNPEKLGDNPGQRRAVLIFGGAPDAATAVAPPSETATALPSLAAPEKLKAQDVITLKNLLFKNMSGEFLPQSAPVLEELYTVLRANPGLKIRIEGHVCCGGTNAAGGPDADYGQEISELRVAAVYTFLVAKGIAKDRLTVAGRGFSAPKFFPERNEEERTLNRRVEIVITGVE